MNQKFPQLIGFGLIIDIILLDQLSKWWITEYILRPEAGGEPFGLFSWITNAPDRLGFVSIPLIDQFNLTMVWNQGVSFGMLQNAGIWPLTILALVISAVLATWLIKSTSKFEAIALGLIIGGAIGNVIDRLRFGAVADFFDVYIGTYHWPAFNIADSTICIGVAMLLIHGLFLDKANKNQKET